MTMIKHQDFRGNPILAALEKAQEPLFHENSTAHRIKLNRVLERPPVFSLPQKVICRLHKTGFSWIVPFSFIQQFPYCANLCGTGAMWNQREIVMRESGSVFYTGDVPDWALDNIEKAKRCGLKYFTIHAFEPLPITIVRMSDPVVLGWYDTPWIHVASDGRIRSKSVRAGLLQAFVIAVWGEDGEKLA